MKKVLIYSILLIIGLIGSQVLGGVGKGAFDLITLWSLSFIMIQVGIDFDIDRSNPKQYLWDYVVAVTASGFPWIFCTGYFVWVLNVDSWQDAIVLARFSSPTSAGVLFSMLAAAGLSATWVFRKARVLAIFDDFDTILLMIPIKIMMVGLRWELVLNLFVIVLLLYLAWKYTHRVELPRSYPWVLLYAGVITLICELIYFTTNFFDDVIAIQLEAIIPAFALGCLMKKSKIGDSRPENRHHSSLDTSYENGTAAVVIGAFMLSIGLSIPPVSLDGLSPGSIFIHVLLITLISNLGKMYPLVCYRGKASLNERLALSISMFIRGEIGAGVLVGSIGYGLGGIASVVAVFSMALNLALTGLFIFCIRWLIKDKA